jgi:hypothetical protein
MSKTKIWKKQDNLNIKWSSTSTLEICNMLAF